MSSRSTLISGVGVCALPGSPWSVHGKTQGIFRDYSNEYNECEGGGIRNNDKLKQNRMLENYVCNDRIRNDEVANILLSFNRNNELDNRCNDKEEKNSEGENKGDKNDRFEANVNMSGHELGEGNVCIAEECGVDD